MMDEVTTLTVEEVQRVANSLRDSACERFHNHTGFAPVALYCYEAQQCRLANGAEGYRVFFQGVDQDLIEFRVFIEQAMKEEGLLVEVDCYY